ncbi:MAG: M2 family metallopeptidase [Bradymonadales bacterium]|jgi:peptidyl-dipeptidase A
MKKLSILSVLCAFLSFACSPTKNATTSDASTSAQAQTALPTDCSVERGTPDPVGNFLVYANDALREAVSKAELKAWDYMTNINPDTEAGLTAAEEELMAKRSEIVAEAAKFTREQLICQDQELQLRRIKSSLSLPPPSDAENRKELAAISAKLVGFYGAANSCDDAGKCLNIGELSNIMQNSRDYDTLLSVWKGWRAAFASQRTAYSRFVQLANVGAKDLGYDNVGALWLDGYDVAPKDFEAQIEKLYQELQPLYEQLHCYVRAKLAEHYGEDKVSLDKPIPAHLLGNMWAQEWANVYPLVAPYPEEAAVDITPAIVQKNWSAEQMTKIAENFFVSLGMRELPASFYTKSMLEKPADREVVCHASAWDIDTKGDVRIKMCIEPKAEDLYTIHHELGHIYYYLYYNHLPFVYQTGANDGFHEGIGDTLTLSMTPAYLKEIGLLDNVATSKEAIINQQMLSALERVAFIPFGLLIDKWRWKVFDGSVRPEQYNSYWWQLREELQGVSAPEPRGEEHFDPGAKYHIPGNTPYLRYYLARFLQFQFHKALCQAAKFDGPLYECSIYNNKDAGKALIALLQKGASQNWQQTLEELTGSPAMSSAAMLEYYEPLIAFLKEANAGKACGW